MPTNDWVTVAHDPGDWQGATPASDAAQPESFGGGFWNTIKGAIQGLSDATNPRRAMQSAAALIQAHRDQLHQAEDAFSKGRYSEASGHMLAAVIPGAGPAAAHAADTIGGTEPQYDKYGNVIRPGTSPNLGGGLGEAAGLLSLSAAPEVANRVGVPAVETVANLPGKVSELAHSPGAAKMTGGAAQVAGAAGSLFSGHPFVAADLAVRGAQMFKKGIAERGAAAAFDAASGGHDIELLNAIAGQDFMKLGPKAQAGIVDIANRLDKPLPPEPATPQPPLPRSHYGLEETPPPPAAAAPAPDPDFLAQYSRAIRPEDEVFREQYQRAVRPEDEVFLEQYRRSVQPGAPEETGGVLAEGTPRTNGPVRPPLAQPNPPAPAIPAPNAGGGGPLRPPLAVQRIADRLHPAPEPAAAGAAAGTPAPSGAQLYARQLFDQAKESGTIPKEAEPGKPIGGEEPEDPQAYIEAARSRRATSAETFAGVFHQTGLEPVDVGNITIPEWKTVSQSLGIEWPKTSAAQVKLIRDVTKALMEKRK